MLLLMQVETDEKKAKPQEACAGDPAAVCSSCSCCFDHHDRAWRVGAPD
jgi:hypothetical protein